MTNTAYLGCSLDGYIADRAGGFDWLYAYPNPDRSDFGFGEFMARIDALVMGRRTFETVMAFDQWPYRCPVFVMSRRPLVVPAAYRERAEGIEGDPRSVVAALDARGLRRRYIDGGLTVQGFLAQDLIDELIITRVPVVLGGGVPLFGGLPEPLHFVHRGTEVLHDTFVKSRYTRSR